VLVQRGAAPLSPCGRPTAVAAATAAVVGLVAVVDPNESGHYPSCPFLSLTGLACPGCGSLRGVHALAHGDLFAAVSFNALMVAAVPVLAWLWLRWVHRCRTGAPRPRPVPAAVLWSFAVVVVVFGVARNLPFGAALAP
jgi:hypothetical protein